MFSPSPRRDRVLDVCAGGMRPEKERERRGLSVVVASCSAPMVVEREREREVTKIFWREGEKMEEK